MEHLAESWVMVPASHQQLPHLFRLFTWALELLGTLWRLFLVDSTINAHIMLVLGIRYVARDDFLCVVRSAKL